MQIKKENIVLLPLTKIKPYKKNAKKHPKEQVERIANSIKRFGFTIPILVDGNNIVIAGHGRCLAAKMIGIKEVPCLVKETWTEEEVKAYRLIDNKVNESTWDEKIIDEELKQILEIDMDVFGFEIDEPEELEEIEPDVKFTEILNEENNYIVLKFENKIDWINALGLLGIEKVKAYPTKKDGKNKETFGLRAGVGRVVNGVDLLRKIQNDIQ